MSDNYIRTLRVYEPTAVPSMGGTRLLSASPVALWTAKAERSGNPILPDDVYRVLLEECDKRPGPAQHHTFGELLNAVAWRTRHLGMGLSRKTGGQRVDSPVGEIAEDIICHTSGHHWDVLGGAAVGQPLRPGQGPSIGIIDLRARPWVAPVEPAGSVTPAPVHPPSPSPAPQPPPSTDLSALKAQLATVLEQQQVIIHAMAHLGGEVASTKADLHHLIGYEVLPHIDDCKRLVVGAEREERFR